MTPEEKIIAAKRIGIDIEKDSACAKGVLKAFNPDKDREQFAEVWKTLGLSQQETALANAGAINAVMAVRVLLYDQGRLMDAVMEVIT